MLVAGALLVWALGLYVISRSPTRRVSILATAAMACLACYLLGEALAALAPDQAVHDGWLRVTWWAPSIVPAIWLVLTLTLAVDEDLHVPGSRPRQLYFSIGVGALTIGVVFGLLGVATDLVIAWDRGGGGLLLRLLQAFVMLCLLWSLLNLVLLTRASPSGTPLRATFAFLVASAVLFLIGGSWLVVASGFYGQPGMPGQAALIAGMAILGWNLARYGALLSGEQVMSDFLAFMATMLAIVVVYGGIVVALAPDYGWLERGLPLLLLVMVTHVLVDTRGHLLDRVLYVPGVSSLRGQLRDLSNRIVRQPDELSALVDVRETVDQILRPTELRVLVEGALRHLNDLPTLAEHPLLDELPSVSSDAAGTPLERAATLRNELEQAIERLRPSGARPSPGTSNIGGWLHYLVLKEAYADGRPNKQVMQRYALSEGTFFRARRRALEALASDFAERFAQPRAAERSPSASSGPTRSTV